jgi:ADP-ribosylglycohydrolase
MVFGSFVADSLALGAHWIYDQDALEQKFGRVTELLTPLPNSYHPRKQAGDQTHYGDQALVLLDSLAAQGRYDHADFAKRWEQLWVDYPDYLDHATKETLANLKTGGGPSDSEELGGAARIAPLLASLAHAPLEAQIAAARDQTALTHGTAIAQEAAEFLTRTVHGILDGAEILPALEKASRASYDSLTPKEYLARVVETQSLDIRAAADELGQACPAEQALPTVIALISRYSDDVETALIENVMAGGDSAARGLTLGLLLGAQHGRSALPPRWVAKLKDSAKIEKFLRGLAR